MKCQLPEQALDTAIKALLGCQQPIVECLAPRLPKQRPAEGSPGRPQRWPPVRESWAPGFGLAVPAVDSLKVSQQVRGRCLSLTVKIHKYF